MDAEYKRLEKAQDKLTAEVVRRMAPPHPSIVYSPENDADGLSWRFNGVQERYIHATEIDRAFSNAKLPPITQEKADLAARLQERLKLSKSYTKEEKRIYAELGGDKLDKRIDRVVRRVCKAQAKIERAKPLCRADLRIKLERYNDDPHDCFTEYLARDLQLVFDNPMLVQS